MKSRAISTHGFRPQITAGVSPHLVPVPRLFNPPPVTVLTKIHPNQVLHPLGSIRILSLTSKRAGALKIRFSVKKEASASSALVQWAAALWFKD